MAQCYLSGNVLKCSKCDSALIDEGGVDGVMCPKCGVRIDLSNRVITTPMNPMQALILDLAAAIEDPCGADEIRLARIVVKLLTRTPVSQRVHLAEALEMANEFMNQSSSMTEDDKANAEERIRSIVIRMRNAEQLEKLGSILGVEKRYE